MFGPKAIEPPGECRSNHEVISALAHRLGASHRGFAMSPREIIDWTLRASKHGTLAELEEKKWLDVQPPFEEAHFTRGFRHKDKKFHFRADWARAPFSNIGLMGPWETMPALPDHWAVNEGVDAEHPFKLATSPARGFLNSTFSETPGSLARERRPCVMMHPLDAIALDVGEGDILRLGNERGAVRLHVKLFDGVQRGVLISEGIWPSEAFLDKQGINVLTSDEAAAPFGGAAFHDIKVWARKG